jgi:hypothetical protein
MRIKSLAALLACALPAAAAHAPAPAAATNKSIELNWRETRTDKIIWSGKINNFSIENKLTIYISSQGQVFSELLRNNNVVRQAGNEKPQGNNQLTWKIKDWHFEGQTLVGLQEFGPTGARRLSIQFDGGYGNCHATIQSGRTSGAKTTIATYMDTGVQAEVLSETIEPPSCAVREGNAFGH